MCLCKLAGFHMSVTGAWSLMLMEWILCSEILNCKLGKSQCESSYDELASKMYILCQLDAVASNHRQGQNLSWTVLLCQWIASVFYYLRICQVMGQLQCKIASYNYRAGKCVEKGRVIWSWAVNVGNCYRVIVNCYVYDNKVSFWVWNSRIMNKLNFYAYQDTYFFLFWIISGWKWVSELCWS